MSKNTKRIGNWRLSFYIAAMVWVSTMTSYFVVTIWNSTENGFWKLIGEFATIAFLTFFFHLLISIDDELGAAIKRFFGFK